MKLRLTTAVLLVALSAAVGAQTGSAQWIVWTRDHHFPVTSMVSTPGDDYADLQFLKSVIGDRRLVQLGESGHGVAEFDSAKVRLIKFLHEEMGFDVIAFESSIYECFAANARSGSATDLLSASIFAVWNTEEVRPLFQYILNRRETERPLELAGFDSQISSPRGVTTRPAFFRKVVGAVDDRYAADVAAFDSDFVARLRNDRTAYPRAQEFYEGLAAFLRARRETLAAMFADDPSPLIAERAATSMVAYVRQLQAGIDRPTDTSPNGGNAIRDAAMADNLTFLARDLYPNRKLVIWAHNFHVRHANEATSSVTRTMGSYVLERFRPELYTIGLYMNRGTAAFNDRSIYAIDPAPQGSMEWVLAGTGPPALFVDFLHQTLEDGNAWMFTPVVTREWGTSSLRMVPRDQYDGVLFLDLVSSPHYLPF